MNITTGIASTTHIDKHGDRFAKSALDDMALQIQKKFIPHLIEHDPKQQVGAALYGEVFKLGDGEYALGVVTGYFENDTEKIMCETGKPNILWAESRAHLDIDALLKMHENNENKGHAKISPDQTIADLIETHLDSTQVMPDGTVYKIKRFIASTGDLSIDVYAKDHKYDPHFHVISKQRSIDARFDLETLEVISMKEGKIKPNDVKKIRAFFKIRPDKLKFLKDEHKRLNRDAE
jgi:hypothetical protein